MAFHNKKGSERICAVCGESFIYRSHNAKYCSKECGLQVAYKKNRDITASRLMPIKCPVCGDEFTPYRSDREDKLRTCSSQCNTVAFNKKAGKGLPRLANCIQCGEEFMATDGMNTVCSAACTKIRSSACESMRQQRPEVRRRTRQTDVLRKYGLSPDEHDRMYEDQRGRCAICGVHQSEMALSLAVDHCHESGVVRGLLCGQCNIGLGAFRDNVDFLNKAVAYLNASAALMCDESEGDRGND